MNQEFKNYLAVSWDRVLSNREDILKLFEELDLQDLDGHSNYFQKLFR